MRMGSPRFGAVVVLLAVLLPHTLPRSARAEEGGSGHYFPGSLSSFVDGAPADKSFILRYNLIAYDGGVDATVPIPIGGSTTFGANATVWGHGFTVAWCPGKLGGNWAYSVSATLPVLAMDVRGDVQVAGTSPTVSRSDEISGVGDLILIPAMLNYHASADQNASLRVAIYAPTGNYQKGRLANTGKNFWTIEPILGWVYLGARNGRELSLFTGLDFNTENPDTKYTSGTQFHADGTLAQHLKLGDGVAGIGVTGFYYQQIGDDTGEGASLGAFRARDVAWGPTLSHISKVGGEDLLVEFKWLHEVEVEKRLKGDSVLLKAAVKF